MGMLAAVFVVLGWQPALAWSPLIWLGYAAGVQIVQALNAQGNPPPPEEPLEEPPVESAATSDPPRFLDDREVK